MSKKMIYSYLQSEKGKSLFNGKAFHAFIFYFFTVFFLWTEIPNVNAQTTVSWPNNYKIYFVADSAHCRNDGRIRYGILYQNEDGKFDTVGATGKRTLTELGLSNARIYKKAHPADEPQYAEYHGKEDTFNIKNAGMYYIGLEATSGVYIYDTMALIEIGTDYVTLRTPPMINDLSSADGYGLKPSLTCENTGRIQLQVIGGRYPLDVKYWPEGAGTNDTVSRHHNVPQQSGQDPNKYDYKEYYSLDNISAGTWGIQVTDACHNSGQMTVVTVPGVVPPVFHHLEVYATPPHTNDSNIVRVKAFFKYPKHCRYYLDSALKDMQYKFYLGMKSHSFVVKDGENTNWHNLTQYTTVNDTIASITLHDTVHSVSTYGAIWGSDYKTFRFEIQYDSCNVNNIKKHKIIDFVLLKPNENAFALQSELVLDSIYPLPDGCTNGTIKENQYNSYYSATYSTSTTYRPERTYSPGDLNSRFYYTHPLVWRYDTLNSSTQQWVLALTDTIPVSKTINTKSVIKATDFNVTPQESGTTIPIRRTLVDVFNNTLYGPTVVNPAPEFQLTKDSSHHAWDVNYYKGDPCCSGDNPCRIVLTEVDTPLYAPLGKTHIHLIESPHGNMYNFHITYDPATRTWSEPIRSNVANTLSFSGESNGRSLTIEQPCLSSGKYRFTMSTGNCAGNEVFKRIDFGDIYSTEIIGEPAYELTQDCQFLKVKFTEGRARLVKHKTDPDHDSHYTTTYTSCVTEIQVVNGPRGGYTNNTFALNQDIRLTVPGTYTIRITPKPTAGQLCETRAGLKVFEDVIIVYDTSSTQHATAEAMLCRTTDNEGNVYVKSNNGATPLTYILYSNANTEGNGLDTIQTNGLDGVLFENISFNQNDILSCLIIDNCSSHTTVSPIEPVVLANKQKVWFDDGSASISACEGETVSLNALQLGEQFSYQWWYFDHEGHRVDTNTNNSRFNLFLRHGMPSGYFHVKIKGTGCNMPIEDSLKITVNPVPSLWLSTNNIELVKDKTVCPAMQTNIYFRPNNVPFEPGDSLVIAYANKDSIDYRSYTFNAQTSMLSDLIAVTSLTKVYPVYFIKANSDCTPYTAADPEDTVFLRMDVEHMMNKCSLITDNITQCTGTHNVSLQAYDNSLTEYKVNWYTNYEQTNLAKTEYITQNDRSNIIINTLNERIVYFVNVNPSGNYCPAINGITDTSLYLGQDDITTLECGHSYRLFDSGGENGNYTADEIIQHSFRTTPGHRILLRFNSLDLSNASSLFVLSGYQPLTDSLLYQSRHPQTGAFQQPPAYLLSNSNVMTLYFMAGQQAAPGWDAVIERAPIAIADVYPQSVKNVVIPMCKRSSATNSCPDLANLIPNITPNEKNSIVDKINNTSGQSKVATRIGSRDANNCDSIINYFIDVKNPPRIDQMVTISTLDTPYIWTWAGHTLGKFSSSTRIDKIVTSNDCDCDTVVGLTLYVLDVKMSENQDICPDGEVELWVSEVTIPDSLMSVGDANDCAVGDVLFIRGDDMTTMSTMRPEAFIDSCAQNANLHAIGVVFDVGVNGIGKAIALKDATVYNDGTNEIDSICQWSYYKDKNGTVTNGKEITDGLNYSSTSVWAIQDIAGQTHTNRIKSCCLSLTNPDVPEGLSEEMKKYEIFKKHAPAAFYCTYYNHRSCYPGANIPTAGLTYGDTLGWYLPAAGELYLCFSRRDIVNSTLYKLKELGYKAKLPYEGKPQGLKLKIIKQIPTNTIQSVGKEVEVDCKYHTSTEVKDKTELVYRIDYKGMINRNDQHYKYFQYKIIVEDSDGNQYYLHQVKKDYAYMHFARAIIQFDINH
jgi:hypothetical protein